MHETSWFHNDAPDTQWVLFFARDPAAKEPPRRHRLIQKPIGLEVWPPPGRGSGAGGLRPRPHVKMVGQVFAPRLGLVPRCSSGGDGIGSGTMQVLAVIADTASPGGQPAHRRSRREWLAVDALLDLRDLYGGSPPCQRSGAAVASLGLQISTVATLIPISSSAGLVVSFVGDSIADRIGRKPVMVAAQAAHAIS